MTQKINVSGELLVKNAYDAEIRFTTKCHHTAPVSPAICNGQTGSFPVQFTAIFDDHAQLLAVDDIKLGGDLS